MAAQIHVDSYLHFRVSGDNHSLRFLQIRIDPSDDSDQHDPGHPNVHFREDVLRQAEQQQPHPAEHI